tara:strand:+ start:6379 stop:7623 length:1245 start_codon:yes stop_codon:yes gene_type:complete
MEDWKSRSFAQSLQEAQSINAGQDELQQAWAVKKQATDLFNQGQNLRDIVAQGKEALQSGGYEAALKGTEALAGKGITLAKSYVSPLLERKFGEGLKQNFGDFIPKSEDGTKVVSKFGESFYDTLHETMTNKVVSGMRDKLKIRAMARLKRKAIRKARGTMDDAVDDGATDMRDVTSFGADARASALNDGEFSRTLKLLGQFGGAEGGAEDQALSNLDDLMGGARAVGSTIARKVAPAISSALYDPTDGEFAEGGSDATSFTSRGLDMGSSVIDEPTASAFGEGIAGGYEEGSSALSRFGGKVAGLFTKSSASKVAGAVADDGGGSLGGDLLEGAGDVVAGLVGDSLEATGIGAPLGIALQLGVLGAEGYGAYDVGKTLVDMFKEDVLGDHVTPDEVAPPPPPHKTLLAPVMET